MRKTTHDDVEDCTDFYDRLCEWVDDNKEAHPITLFTAIAGALWYIAPELGLDAKMACREVANLMVKWERRMAQRKSKEKSNED